MRDPRRIRELGERRLGEIAERTERLEVELKDLLEKNKGKPELRLVSEEIKRSLRELAPLANILARENDRRENLPELRTVLATNNPFQVNELLVSADKPALGQAADAARIEQFSLEKTLNFSPLSGTEARGDVTVRSLMQAMIETLSIEATDRLSELLARVLSSMVTDRTVKAIERAVERSGELTENEIERAIAEINDELAELSSRTSTYRQPLVLRERIQGAELLKDKQEQAVEAQKTDGTERIAYRVIYDRLGKVVRIEITGRQALRLVANALAPAMPRSEKAKAASVPDILPAIFNNALAMIENDPLAKMEIAEMTAKVITLILALLKQKEPRQRLPPGYPNRSWQRSSGSWSISRRCCRPSCNARQRPPSPPCSRNMTGRSRPVMRRSKKRSNRCSSRPSTPKPASSIF